MSQPKSQARIELDLFLALRSEPRRSGDEVCSAISLLQAEKVLRSRSRRAYAAFIMARESVMRFNRSDELLPKLAVACLGLLEILDPSDAEQLAIVEYDVLRDALAHRLGAIRGTGIARSQAGVAGLAVAYGGGVFVGGGGGGGCAAATATGHGGSCGSVSADGGSLIAGGGVTSGPQGEGGTSDEQGYTPGSPGWPTRLVVKLEAPKNDGSMSGS